MLKAVRRGAAAGAVLMLLGGCGVEPEAELPGVPATSVAALFYDNSTTPGLSSFVCSGTVVGTLVLTAAHCVPEGRKVRVVVGAVDLCAAHDSATTRVSEVLRPPGATDVAVLVPEGPLPAAEPPPPARGTSWAVTGWGSAPGSFRCGPRTVDLEPAEGCGGEDGAALCLTGNRENTCTGDSGGGVVDAGRMVVAVTSSGAGCAPGDPGTYATLASVADWLATAGVTVRPAAEAVG